MIQRKKLKEVGISRQHNPSVIGRASTAGITLVALVVTIVVLLILAGITLVYVFGDNGIINKGIEASLMMKVSEIEEKALLIYTNLKMKAEKKLSEDEIIEVIVRELNNAGYQIYEEKDEKGIDEIILNTEEIHLTHKEGNTAQIEVEIKKGIKAKRYYAVVDNNYYLMDINENKIKIEREPSNINEEIDKVKEIEASSDNETSVTIKEIKDNIITIESKQVGEAIVTVKYGNSKPKSCHVIVEEPERFPMTINYTKKEYYEYSEKLKVSIKYETDKPIDFSTVIANETIKIKNENGAESKIETIENLEKETILEIDVGNKSGEFFICVDGIKNQNGEGVASNTSDEILVGNRMQRMIMSIQNKSGNALHPDRKVLEDMYDNNVNTVGGWVGYSGSVEIKFKKSEKIKRISIWTGVSPSTAYVIKIYGLQQNNWKEIAEMKGNLSATYLKFETLLQEDVIEGIYDGIKIDVSYPSSYVGISEFAVE